MSKFDKAETMPIEELCAPISAKVHPRSAFYTSSGHEVHGDGAALNMQRKGSAATLQLSRKKKGRYK